MVKRQISEPSSTPNEDRRGWLKGNVFYMGLTSLLGDLSHEAATAILPSFLTVQLHVGPEALGLIEGASDGASSMVKIFSGYWSDRMGKRKPLMNFGYALTGVLGPMIAVTTAWPQVLLLRMSAWAGRGARGPPRDALLADSVTAPVRGRAFGFQRAMDTVGAVLGPSLALLLLPLIGYREIFALSAIPGLAAFLVVFFLVREVQRPKGNDSDPQKPPLRKSDSSYIGSLKVLPRRFKLFLVAVCVFGLGNFANSLFALRAQQILAPQYGDMQASMLAIGLYTMLNVVYAVCSIPVGALSDRVGRREILAFGYFLSSVACLGMAFLTADFWVLIPVFLMAGLFTGITDTIEGATAADLLPQDARGTGYGLLQTTNGIGDFVSSTMVGFLWTLVSPQVAFSYAAVLSASGGALLLYLTRGHRLS
jgi:MFS family permease